MEEILKQIISLDRENRRKLAKAVKSNPNVWNAINGFGNVNPLLPKGIIQGLVYREITMEEAVRVIATKYAGVIETTGSKGGKSTIVIPTTGIVAEAETNSEGTYAIYLPVGNFDLYFVKTGTPTVLMQNISSVSDYTKTINVKLS